MYIMHVCLFSALSHRVSALQISIIIITQLLISVLQATADVPATKQYTFCLTSKDHNYSLSLPWNDKPNQTVDWHESILSPLIFD